MDRAKKKRATHRRNVTKLVGKVDDLIPNGVEGIDTIMLKHYMNEQKEKRSDLKEFDNEILEILCEKAEDDVIDKEMDEASDYKEKITRALSLIEDALEKSKPKRQLSAGGWYYEGRREIGQNFTREGRIQKILKGRREKK